MREDNLGSNVMKEEVGCVVFVIVEFKTIAKGSLR